MKNHDILRKIGLIVLVFVFFIAGLWYTNYKKVNSNQYIKLNGLVLKSKADYDAYFKDTLKDTKVEGNRVQEKQRVNLNTASEDELLTLQHVGEKIAKSIMEYRDMHGGFKSIEELKEIRNIGDKKFEDLKDLITVE